MKKIIPKLFFLIVIVLIMFLCLEIAFRAFKPQVTYDAASDASPAVFASSDYLPWQLTPSATDMQQSPHGEFNVTVHVNDLGLRDNGFSNDASVKRILLFGASFTFGHGVELHETYASVLEQALGKDYDVINAAYASGYSPDTYALYLQQEGMAFDPDVVMIGLYVGNDITDLFKNTYQSPEHITSDFYYIDDDNRLRRSMYNNEGSFTIFLRTHSHMFVYLKEKFHWMFRTHYTKSTIYDVDYDEALQEKFDQLTTTLIDIHTFTAALDIPLVIVLIPTQLQLDDMQWEAYASHTTPSVERLRVQTLLTKLFEEQDISVIDLYDGFHSYDDIDTLYFAKDGHWNPEGHTLAAEIITEEFLALHR